MIKKFEFLTLLVFIGCTLGTLGRLCAEPTHETPVGKRPVVVKRSRFIPMPVSKESEEGKALFSEMKCINCHSIGDEGGCLGPPLAGEGGFRSRGFLYARLTNTKEAEEKFQNVYTHHPELMPHPRFAPETVQKLVAYILTLPAPEHGYQIIRHHPQKTEAQVAKESKPATKQKIASAKDITQGSKLFYEQGCAACHAIGNIGGSLAPPLDTIGSRRDLQYITDHITDAQFHTRMINPDAEPSKMPHFKATEPEIDQIALFLSTLKSKK